MDQIIEEALDLQNLPLPPRPSVVEIRFHPYEDSAGEDSLEIIVLLNDETTDDDLTGENVMQITSSIRDSLIAKGIKLFPYVRLIKQSEYQPEATYE